MHFLTRHECSAWATGIDVALDDRGTPSREFPIGWHTRSVRFPAEQTRLLWFCRHIEQSLQPRSGCLMWVTDWGIWRSSENNHLYYRLRQSYGDHRQLHEAPGHYFHDYETPDLVTFLELAVLFGWDAHLLPVTGYARAFVSHDEFVDFAADPNNLVIANDFATPFATPPVGGAA